MNRKIISIITITAMLSCVAGCGKKDIKKDAETKGQNVTVYTANVSPIESNVTYTGEIKASESVSLVSKLSAKALNVYVKEGDYVEKGTVLARLDDTDAQLAYSQAAAGYNSAKAAHSMTVNSSIKQAEAGARQALESAQLAYESALNTYNREKNLYDNNTTVITAKNALQTAQTNLENTQRLFDMGAASQVELDNAKNAAENAKAAFDTAAAGAKAQLDGAEINLKNAENALANAKDNINLTAVASRESAATAEASVQTAHAALAIAENNVKNAVITAPISGTIASCNAHEGQMVAAGTEVFSIKQSNYVDAEIAVTESVIPYIYEGTPATISVGSVGIKNKPATVTVVNPVKNLQTGMFTVKVSIDNTDGAIKVGMFADITLVTRQCEAAIIIPAEAIIRDGAEAYVYVSMNSVAEKRIVETGIENPEFTEILSGVSDGELVVVSGKEYISETNNKLNITSYEEDEQ